LPIGSLPSHQLSEILNALEKKQPGSNFTEMLIPLQEAGVQTLDEVLLRGETMLVEWTGLPLDQVTALCDYTKKLSIGKSPVPKEEPTSDDMGSESDSESEGD
jgi:hypothetical protein